MIDHVSGKDFKEDCLKPVLQDLPELPRSLTYNGGDLGRTPCQDGMTLEQKGEKCFIQGEQSGNIL